MIKYNKNVITINKIIYIKYIENGKYKNKTQFKTTILCQWYKKNTDFR